jgi:4-hydroxybenzoate polyprenyltransferase
MSALTNIWISMRPGQWTKNLALFAPIVFAQKAFDPVLLGRAIEAFVLFCATSSCIYMVNDLFDKTRDTNHPVKGRRPIASGALSPTAAATAVVLIAAPVTVLSFCLNLKFGLALLGYAALNLAYSAVLKHFVIIDVMTIAMGFVLRVVAGAVAISVPASSWLFLCTILLALFLGFGKRRHELVILDRGASAHRAILREYSPYFLDQMISVVTASTVVAYSLYATSSEVEKKLGTPYLYLTIPYVLYGVFRYLYLIHQKEEGGSPSSLLANDRPLLINILLWAATAMVVLYPALR